MSTAADPKDPRFRNFRRVAWAVYLTFTTAFALLITYSVISSTLKMSPPQHPAEPSLAVELCVAKARALFTELDKKRDELSSAKEVRVADTEWSAFRLDWLERKQQLEARCVGDSPEREKLRPVFKTLQSLMNLYTTHAVQYAGEIGPSVDKLRKQLDEAVH